MESKVSIKELKEFSKKFQEERDWDKYHTPKDVAIALSVEAGEVLELFLWKSDKEVEEMLKDPIKKNKVTEEVADVFSYLILLSNKLDIDLVKSFYEKMDKNHEKYPIDKIKGDFKKYTEI